MGGEESLAHGGVATEAEPSQVAFSLFLCLFSVHLGVHCQTLCCSVFFLVLSFKADLKGTDAVQTGGSACQTPTGSLAGLFGSEEVTPCGDVPSVGLWEQGRSGCSVLSLWSSP